MFSFMITRKLETAEVNYNVNKYGVLRSSINWLYKKTFEQLRA